MDGGDAGWFRIACGGSGMQSKQLGPFVSTRGSTWMLVALAGGVHFAVPTNATAQDATWTGPGNEWTTSSNWTPATPTNNARFTNNGAPTAVNISGNASDRDDGVHRGGARLFVQCDRPAHPSP